MKLNIMSDKKTPTDLQTLWEELTQSEEVQRKRIRDARYEQRAKQYAAPQDEAISYSEDEVYEVLVFQLGAERYGIDAAIVTGVRPAEKITRVPSVPEFYRGVVNIRGQIISVLDLRLFFGLSVAEDTALNELILVETPNLALALVANYIEEVQVIPRTTVETVDMRYAVGVTSNRIVIIDPEYLLSDERLIIGGEKQS